jgi:hypothetical protein
MTVESSGDELRAHHGAQYSWGWVNISVGAAALFELRPLDYDEMVPRFRVVVGKRPNIVHPPLNILLATTAEVGRPTKHQGLDAIVMGRPTDDAWEFIFWGDSPPPVDHPELVAYEAAHGFSKMAELAVSGYLPELLKQEGCPPVTPQDAQRHAALLGRIVGGDIHGLYCAEPHPWPL